MFFMMMIIVYDMFLFSTCLRHNNHKLWQTVIKFLFCYFNRPGEAAEVGAGDGAEED